VVCAAACDTTPACSRTAIPPVAAQKGSFWPLVSMVFVVCKQQQQQQQLCIKDGPLAVTGSQFLAFCLAQAAAVLLLLCSVGQAYSLAAMTGRWCWHAVTAAVC
jgi:hypothetical protein